MKREEKKKLKAKELQEKILNETYKENFQPNETDYMVQPFSATMMKGTMTLTQDEIFESIMEAFQAEFRKQIAAKKLRSGGQLSLWDKETVKPVRVYFKSLGVRPDSYDEVHQAALELGKQVVDMPGVNEDGDVVINYMPLFTKVSVPVTKLEEINRSDEAKKTPYKNNERRKGYIEFSVNPEVGHEYFEITQMYTKFVKNVAKKCKCMYSPKMYRYAANWRDMGGKWEFEYIDFRRLLGLRHVMPIEKDGKTVYEEVDTTYPDFGDVKRFVLEKTQKDVKRVADKNEFDCYFTYEVVMPKKANGERATRGNPEKIVFYVHLSELGERTKKYNNTQQMNIRLELLMMKELYMSKQSATSLTSRITEEIRLKFSNKVMDLIKYIIDPKNGVKDRGGYAYMALSNFLEEITPSAMEIIPEKSPTLDNNQAGGNVQQEAEDSGIVGNNSGSGQGVGNYSAEALPVWWKVLDFIRERMARELFDIHILPLYPYSFGDNVLTIAAPNEYIYKEVQTKYAARLLEIIRERFGASTEAKYVMDNRRTDELVKMYEEHCTKK